MATIELNIADELVDKIAEALKYQTVIKVLNGNKLMSQVNPKTKLEHIADQMEQALIKSAMQIDMQVAIKEAEKTISDKPEYASVKGK